MDGTALGQLQAWRGKAVSRYLRGLKPGPQPLPSPGGSLLLPSGPVFTLYGQTGSLHISLPSAKPLSPCLGWVVLVTREPVFTWSVDTQFSIWHEPGMMAGWGTAVA